MSRHPATSFGAKSTRVPHDPALPGMAALFDAARAGAALQAAAGVRLGEGRVTYVRHKPGTSCVAAYEFRRDGDPAGPLTCYGKALTAADFATGTMGLGLHRWTDSAPFPPYMVLDSERVVLFVFPNDPALDGLRLFASAKRMQRALHRELADYPPDVWRISDGRLRTSVVRYKPEKRAVLRVETKAVRRADGERRTLTVYGRVYGEGESHARHEVMERIQRAAEGRLRVPRVLAHLDDRHTVLVEKLDGDPLGTRLRRHDVGDSMREAGAVLARLHSVTARDIPVRAVDALIEDARATAESIASVLPEAGPRAHALADRLDLRSRAVEPTLTFVHGDYHPDQLLVHEQGMGVLDFDRSYGGCGAADVGNFQAHLTRLEIEGAVEGGPALASCFLEGYAALRQLPRADVMRFWTALAMLQLAIRPFRLFEAEWPARVEAMLGAAEATAP